MRPGPDYPPEWDDEPSDEEWEAFEEYEYEDYCHDGEDDR